MLTISFFFLVLLSSYSTEAGKHTVQWAVVTPSPTRSEAQPGEGSHCPNVFLLGALP